MWFSPAKRERYGSQTLSVLAVKLWSLIPVSIKHCHIIIGEFKKEKKEIDSPKKVLL
jgi:hypothetical protein